MTSYHRARSSSPFSHRKSASAYSSSNSSSSSYNGSRIVPRSGTMSSNSCMNSSSCGYGSRSTTPCRSRPDIYFDGGNRNRSPVPYEPEELVAVEPIEGAKNGDSISVTIRFRPLSVKEFQRGDEIAWYADGDKIVRSEYGPTSAYAFDKVFGEHTITQDVYDVAAKPVVQAAMEGVNGTVFAYGVTSSGKTFTMHGDQHCPGVIPLAIKDVFRIIQDTPGREFLLRVSYIEIYNEVINDLLDPTGQNLRIREDSQGTYVEGIKEEVVLSPGHALSFIAAGEEHRHVGSNNFNLFSSRSHTIFTLMIESSAHGEEYDGVIFSQLNLIDLAGSESSKTETTGLRRKEGSYINKSLLTLGTVIGKLSEGRSSHVPYRDSKLTRLLQSSLSGHGHVSLICTVTPASSNLEETHNTLKFASRAKRVEIFAERNKIIDEKSLIKKYQREISTLKEELTHLKRGMVGISREEILSLKQKLEEGQVKMQSRLEEEEEAKAALMSRIQRLTKLILVSTKSAMPGLTDVTNQQGTLSPGEIDQAGGVNGGGSSISESKIWDGSSTSPSVSPDALSNLNDITLSTFDEETSSAREGTTLTRGISSDEMDLLVEQVKMLAEEVALGTSTLKRLVEQSTNDPPNSQEQIQALEREILEKRKQMRALEQRLFENGEASIAKSSLVDTQQTVIKLMAQCNEKAFELELKSADNRILQDQLQSKCAENEELLGKIKELEQRLVSLSANSRAEVLVNDLKRKIHSQELYNERLIIDQVQLSDENAELREQNQKLADDASYAKELASAAAAELKNLAGEITKLSLLNGKLEKELIAYRTNSFAKKHSDSTRTALRKSSKFAGRNGDFGSMHSGDLESWDLDPDDLKIELMARKQREAALEAALADKESIENEYRKMAEDSKKREAALENDLANMWVLVAKMKKDGVANTDFADDVKSNVFLEDPFASHMSNATEPPPDEENLVLRFKERMQEINDKHEFLGNEELSSHQCKVCFETPTSVILLPCRHFCLCKACSLACSECPVCRTSIADRLFAFAA